MESLEGGAVEEEFPPDRLFESKSLAARILVISAGVIMNVLFAWAAFSGLLLAYGQAEDPTTTIARADAELLPDAARSLAEIPFGTRVVSLNGEDVTSWNDIIDGVLEPRSERLRFDFAGPVDPIIVEVPGLDAESRGRIAAGLIPLWEPRVGSISAGYPAAEAGIQVGDLITHIDGEALPSWDDLVTAVEPNAGKTLQLTVDREGETLEIALAPAKEEVQDPMTGDSRKVGRIGVGPKIELRRTRLGPVAAAMEGARQTWDNGARVLVFLKGLVMGQVSIRQLGGPVLIGQVSGQAARAGLDRLVWLMAFLSINLAKPMETVAATTYQP